MSGRKSYEFHREVGVTWSLVFDPKSGHWHIEKAEDGGARIRMTLDEFENSPRGESLAKQFADALSEAERDV